MWDRDINKPVFLAILYNNFGPYHLARLGATAELGKKRGKEVVGLELASREMLYPWIADGRHAVDKYTVFPHRAIEEIKAWHLFKGTWSALNTLNPRAIAMGLSKETIVAFFTALFWSRLKKRTGVLMMDSKYDDFPRNPFKERIKGTIYAKIDAALVGGTYSREYAELLGIPANRVWLGCDVVDNDYFAHRADRSREDAAPLRNQYGLPDNYFLYVGRFEEKKNVDRLLEAYARYIKSSAWPSWHLVLCGSGPLEAELREKARQLRLSKVHFAGFTQIEELPMYYGLARCLITPSSHNEQWGLVVNEAMASGLPVLVSKACGCAPDLVQEEVNGYTFDPYHVEGLARLMLKMSSGDIDLGVMGEASRRIIANWSLETYAQNLLQAVEIGMALPLNSSKG